jgi:hypothetical protein
MKPHKKHFCGNCGNDSVWSTKPIVSTPLKPLHDKFSNSNTYITPDRTLNLDKYADCKFELWASTPAVLWTANRPQEKGIHVHVYDKSGRIVDNTFGKVILKGQELERDQMWKNMLANTL